MIFRYRLPDYFCGVSYEHHKFSLKSTPAVLPTLFDRLRNKIYATQVGAKWKCTNSKEGKNMYNNNLVEIVEIFVSVVRLKVRTKILRPND